MLNIPFSSNNSHKQSLIVLLSLAVISCQTTNTPELTPVTSKSEMIETLERGENMELAHYASCLMVAYGHMINISINETGVASIDRKVAEVICETQQLDYATAIKRTANCFGNIRCPNDTVNKIIGPMKDTAYEKSKEYVELYNG